MKSSLDDELEKALQAQEAELSPAVLAPTKAVSKERKPRSLVLLLTLLVLVAAVVVLFLGIMQPAAVYATPVDKLVASQAENVGRRVRVEGELVPGTLAKRDKPCEYRFSMHKNSMSLPVRYSQCVIPESLRDVPGGGVEVTVEGSLQSEGHFEATLVMAKCTSKYDPKTHSMGDQAGVVPSTIPMN